MFDIGGGEFIGLVLLGLLIFGPDRLPALARDAAGMIKKVRSFANSTTSELRQNLDIGDLSDLEPKNLIRKHLLEDEPAAKPTKPPIDPDAT